MHSAGSVGSAPRRSRSSTTEVALGSSNDPPVAMMRTAPIRSTPGDVGTQRREGGQGLRGRARLTDHHDVALRLEQLCDAAPDDLVVVEQEHGDAHGGMFTGGLQAG
jgi:hypothetical protein